MPGPATPHPSSRSPRPARARWIGLVLAAALAIAIVVYVSSRGSAGLAIAPVEREPLLQHAADAAIAPVRESVPEAPSLESAPLDEPAEPEIEEPEEPEEQLERAPPEPIRFEALAGQCVLHIPVAQLRSVLDTLDTYKLPANLYLTSDGRLVTSLSTGDDQEATEPEPESVGAKTVMRGGECACERVVVELVADESLASAVYAGRRLTAFSRDLTENAFASRGLGTACGLIYRIEVLESFLNDAGQELEDGTRVCNERELYAALNEMTRISMGIVYQQLDRMDSWYSERSQGFFGDSAAQDAIDDFQERASARVRALRRELTRVANENAWAFDATVEGRSLRLDQLASNPRSNRAIELALDMLRRMADESAALADALERR